MARKIAAFLEPARETLELALYDVRLDDDTEHVVEEALVSAHERGVHVRLIYNLDEADQRPPVPPPPLTKPDLIESLPFETAGVPGWPDLMHHKYVIRDRDAVWTGSTNWTDDSWTREENVIIIVASRALAIRFQDDFAQLWKTRDVAKSGRVDTSPVDVAGVPVRPWFSPKRGEKLAQRIATSIGAAERRVRVASPVITSGPILGTLAEVAGDGKVERFHQTMAREWAYGIRYSSTRHRAAALPHWLTYYNQRRPHSSLGGLPPTSRVHNVRGQDS